MSKYTMETHSQIWNEDTGDYIKVGPDREGLGLIEIQFKQFGKTVDVTLTRDQVDMLWKSLETAGIEETREG